MSDALSFSEEDRRGPVLRALRAIHVAQMRDVFRREGSTEPWTAWTPRYARYRRKVRLGSRRRTPRLLRQRVGTKILDLTGSMKARFTMPASPFFIFRFVPPFTYQMGARSDVGHWHQTGAGALPVRAIVDKDAIDRAELIVAFRESWLARVRQVLRHA